MTKVVGLLTENSVDRVHGDLVLGGEVPRGHDDVGAALCQDSRRLGADPAGRPWVLESGPSTSGRRRQGETKEAGGDGRGVTGDDGGEILGDLVGGGGPGEARGALAVEDGHQHLGRWQP